MAGNIIGRGQIFQSTLPGWGATVRLRGDVRRVQDFNPRSPDGERPWVPLMRLLSFLISIHAPRMGSDLFLVSGFHSREAFQSTLPGWGATVRLALWDLACRVFQSTLPGWGATVRLALWDLACRVFQSTLPGWGATTFLPRLILRLTLFQSTLPGWGATRRPLSQSPGFRISIHAPRMGSDCRPGPPRCRRCISIHAPRMGSDPAFCVAPTRIDISIHAPRMGSDVPSGSTTVPSMYFNPRSPDGERPRVFVFAVPATANFNPRSPDGERPDTARDTSGCRLFQSTLPGWGATAKMDIFAHDMGKIIHFQH